MYHALTTRMITLWGGQEGVGRVVVSMCTTYIRRVFITFFSKATIYVTLFLVYFWLIMNVHPVHTAGVFSLLIDIHTYVLHIYYQNGCLFYRKNDLHLMCMH